MVNVWDKHRKNPENWCYNSKCNYLKNNLCSIFPFPWHLDNCDDFISSKSYDKTKEIVKSIIILRPGKWKRKTNSK